MKDSFITSLVGYFIEKEYFNLISSETEVLDLSGGSVCLIKDLQGTSVLLEILDGDRFDSQQLAQSMDSGANILNNIEGRNATILKMFLFEDQADSEKIKIITEGQCNIEVERKFLKAFSINISGRTIQKHFDTPSFDANVVRTVKRFFSKELDKSGITIETIQKLLEQRRKDYEIQLKAKKPWLTYCLLAANILVYLIIKLISIKSDTSYTDLLDPFGAKINSMIMQGEYWRFFTPMFLHSDEIHLAINCYSLFIVGSQVERLYGHGKFATIYFVSGILGCIVSFGFSINASVGASGAIFGLLGAMLFFAFKRPSLLRSGFGANLITTLVINLAYGFMNSRIDNHAHIGGLVGGFLTSGVVYATKEETSRDKLLKVVSLIMVIAFTVSGLLYGFNNKENKLLPMLTELQTLDGQQKWTEVEKLAEEIIASKPGDEGLVTEVLWRLTIAETVQKKYDEGIAHANQLIEISPANGHYLLGFIYYDTGKLSDSRKMLLKAKEEGSPKTESIEHIISEIDKMTGK